MKPTIGIIGGTGLEDVLAEGKDTRLRKLATPFGPPSGPVLTTTWEGVHVAFISRHGPGHTIPPSAVPFQANIMALKTLGVTHILATGATGSLREEIKPKDIVIVDQVIDKTFRRPSTFFQAGLAVHVEFAQPFCPTLRKQILHAATALDHKVHHKGTYVCMEGPQFSTVAESNMHRAWGGDLIGMTCMPEAKLAREAEMCYALIALPTDYDCWKPAQTGIDKQTLLAEIMANLKEAANNAAALMRATVRHLAHAPLGLCACQNALELAIWSDKSKVPKNVIEKLRPILGRHFDS